MQKKRKMPSYEFWNKKTLKEINSMDQAHVMHTIEGLLRNLDRIAEASNQNSPKLVLYCDSSFELSEAEDIGTIRYGDNVLAEYNDILYHYGRYTARYQEFENGTISQKELAEQTRQESFDVGEFAMLNDEYTG